MAFISASAKYKLHRFFLSLALFFLFLAASAPIHFQLIPIANSAEVTLAWDPNTEPDLAGYKIYGGTESNGYLFFIDVGNRTSYGLSNLEGGKTYYFVATAYDDSGNESDFSNEVIFETPPACTYSISPASQFFDPQGGRGTVNVTSPTQCIWTAISNAPWLIITSNAQREGNGTIDYSVRANYNRSPRQGTLSIAGQEYAVTQSGILRYAIRATAGLNGSISPQGIIKVNPVRKDGALTPPFL